MFYGCFALLCRYFYHQQCHYYCQCAGVPSTSFTSFFKNNNTRAVIANTSIMWNRAGKSTRYSLLQLVKECSGQLRRKICTKSFNKISTKPNHTTIEWQDGHVSEFHNTWLRDHCRCEKCIDPSTFQRSFDT